MIFSITDQNAFIQIFKVSNLFQMLLLLKFQLKNFKKSLPYVAGTAISLTTSSPNFYFG